MRASEYWLNQNFTQLVIIFHYIVSLPVKLWLSLILFYIHIFGAISSLFILHCFPVFWILSKLCFNFSYTCLLCLEPSNCSCIRSLPHGSSKWKTSLLVHLQTYSSNVLFLYTHTLIHANNSLSHDHKLIRAFDQYYTWESESLWIKLDPYWYRDQFKALFIK